jgi:SpoVK/Ycf46/Vps4 family AAA+-type ATPase
VLVGATMFGGPRPQAKRPTFGAAAATSTNTDDKKQQTLDKTLARGASPDPEKPSWEPVQLTQQLVESDTGVGDNGFPWDDDTTCHADKDGEEITSVGVTTGKSAARSGRDKLAEQEDDIENEHVTYIRENCVVPHEKLTTFAELVGNSVVVAFAESFQVQTAGAVLPISGLLLFGPSGTGKTAQAQAICVHIGGTFYSFSAADLPSGKAGGQRINALFQVAQTGELPAVIFIDECDTLLSTKAAVRIGHFASVWERFKDGLLVIGASNNPKKIAPKLLDGRFERKILVDNPNSVARKAMLLEQLGHHEAGHILTDEDLTYIVDETAGRSAVNLKRLVSTAALDTRGMAVTCDNFQAAIVSEPSDYDKVVASANQEYDRKHGWRSGF